MKKIMDTILGIKWLKITLAVILGGVAGYLYYRLVGCSSGGCPITSKPLNSIIYGALMGLLLSL